MVTTPKTVTFPDGCALTITGPKGWSLPAGIIAVCPHGTKILPLDGTTVEEGMAIVTKVIKANDQAE